MAITVTHSKVSTIPDDADTSLVRPSDWNADHTLTGLGTMAEQNANAVAITGGSITGVSGLGTVTSVGGTGTVNGISLSGTVTSSGNLTLGGTLSGVSLATQVTDNLPVTNLNSGTSASATTFWRGDGSWATPTGGSGTVTSVAATVPSVLSITGSPITTSGTLAIAYSGTALPVANGGTGATTVAEAFADLTPLTLTTASATPLVLTNTSGYQQQITGSTTQTITLPSTATLAVGWSFLITNGTGFTVTVQTSTGATVYANANIGSYRVWVISTANNNAASWSAGAETFSFETGTGSVVRATSPTLSGITSSGTTTITGTLALTGTASSSAQFATNQTTGFSTICSSQTSGTLIIGGVSGTGTQTIGRSTLSQTINIQAGATSTGNTKAINIGTEGLSGSTTNIAIGSTTGTSTTTFNGITKRQTYTVVNLPSASTSGVGASAFVTNALAPTFGATVAGGGAVAVPVYSDGTNWKVG